MPPLAEPQLGTSDTAARRGVRDRAELLALASTRGLQGWGVADQVLPDL